MGHDGVEAFLAGGMGAWREGGLPLASFGNPAPAEAAEMMAREDLLLVDVRSQAERTEVRIGGSFSLPLARLARDTEMLPRDRLILVHCGHGCRGSLAASMLLRAGFPRVANLAGGIVGWRAAGLPVES
jgi:hydroxyacylglutathione hydrolase